MTTDGFPNAKSFFDGVSIYTERMAMFISGSLLQAGINPESIVADSLRQDARGKFQTSRHWEAIGFGSIPDLVTRNLPNVDRNLTNKMFVIREFRNETTHEYQEKGKDIPDDLSETALYLMADVLNRIGQTKGAQEVLAIRDRVRQSSSIPESKPVLPAANSSSVASIPRSQVYPPPPYPPRYAPAAGANREVLNLASVFYRMQLFNHDLPQQMLDKLGITPESAANSGIGFCPGQGLQEFLENNNLESREIQRSLLFNRENGGESFAGQMVLSELDVNGKAVWMTSIPVEVAETAQTWERRSPRPRIIPGRRRSDLVKIGSRTPCDILTNDSRLYIVMAASDLHAALMTYWPRRSVDDLDALCNDLAEELLTRETTRLSLLMHSPDLQRTLTEKIKMKRPEVEVLSHGWDAILRNLDPETRDLPSLTRPPAYRTAITEYHAMPYWEMPHQQS